MSRRVDFARNLDDFRCALLASLGFASSYIEERCGLTGGQISYRLRKAAIKRADYREGRSRTAAIVMRQASAVVAEEVKTKVARVVPAKRRTSNGIRRRA